MKYRPKAEYPAIKISGQHKTTQMKNKQGELQDVSFFPHETHFATKEEIEKLNLDLMTNRQRTYKKKTGIDFSTYKEPEVAKPQEQMPEEEAVYEEYVETSEQI